jgi:hypothetical protein
MPYMLPQLQPANPVQRLCGPCKLDLAASGSTRSALQHIPAEMLTSAKVRLAFSKPQAKRPEIAWV